MSACGRDWCKVANCEYSAAAEGDSERSGRLARPLPTKTWLMFPHSSIVT